MSNQERLTKAVNELRYLCMNGGEFPDAAYATAKNFGVDQAELEALYDEDEVKRQHECPNCGGHTFRMYVLQRIHVEFTPDNDSNVYDGPEGDMEWDDDTEAYCNDCDHYGPLKEMV